MKTAFCTIGTQSHLFKSRALLDSVAEVSSADRFCLLTDAEEVPPSLRGETYHTLRVLDSETARALKRKYTGNRLRWACKPLYLLYLLDAGYDAVIYTDNDIYFFASPDFLFENLRTASVLLTPHFYPADPTREQNWLEANYTVGLYNAGFLGVNQKGRQALHWWAQCCRYAIKKAAWRGLFDDQKYLDLLPVIFPDVQVSRHKGCNVAGWNLELCPRGLDDRGALVFDGRWPLVFIHFTPTTYRAVLNGQDPLLAPCLETYTQALQKHKPAYRPAQDLARGLKDYLLYFKYLRWRLVRLFE